MYTGLRPISFLFVMQDKLILRKTNLYHHWLKVMSEKGKVYKLYTNNKTAIRKLKEGKDNAIMLAGGPKIIEGQLLPNNNDYKVVQISYIQGNYYIVLKEINNEENNQTSDT